MRDRHLLKSGLCSLGSLLSLSVLAVIVATQPLSASRIGDAEVMLPGGDEGFAADVSDETPLDAMPAPEPGANEVHEADNGKLDYTLYPAFDHPDIRRHHRYLTDYVYRVMPTGCPAKLEHFYIRYDNPQQRGLGGKTTMILAGTVPGGAEMSAREIAALEVHEWTHLCVAASSGNAASGNSGWHDGDQIVYADSIIPSYFSLSWNAPGTLKRGARTEDFCSVYGKTDPHEDIAECFVLYLTNYDAMQAQAKDNPVLAAKLAWMETHLPTPLHTVIRGKHVWNGTVPWDATRLPYEWGMLDAIVEAAR